VDNNITRYYSLLFSKPKNLLSGDVVISYVDQVKDLTIYDSLTEAISFVEYSNIHFIRDSRDFYHYLVEKTKEPFDSQFRINSTYFAYVNDHGVHNIYRTYCDIYENYNGIPWSEYEITTERNYAFIDTVKGFSGKGFDHRFYLYFDQTLELQYYFLYDGYKNISARWPVKYIKSVDTSFMVYLDDTSGTLFIDQNNNKARDAGEPMMKSDMDTQTAVYPDNTGLNTPTWIVSIFVVNPDKSLTGKDVTLNYFNNPLFSGFVNSREAYISSIYDEVTERVDDGLDKEFYKGNLNYITDRPEDITAQWE